MWCRWARSDLRYPVNDGTPFPAAAYQMSLFVSINLTSASSLATSHAREHGMQKPTEYGKSER